MEGQRYRGKVKIFKGSFGFVTCGETAERFSGRDVFVHRNDLDEAPNLGATVSFLLKVDDKGNPKGVEAKVEADGPPREAVRDADGGFEGPQILRAALLLLRGDEVLVVREEKEGALRWSDLGGKIEPGERPLDCALRELAEEAAGLLSPASVEALTSEARLRFGDGDQEPEVVIMKAGGRRPHAVAVFTVDCQRLGLELLPKLAEPNAHGVHEIRWLKRADPALLDKQKTRWPLLRTMHALYPAEAADAEVAAPQVVATSGAPEREEARCSRSRSPRRLPAATEAASYDDLFAELVQRLRSDGWEARQEDPPQAYLHLSKPSWGDELMDGIHLETYVLPQQLAAACAPVALHCERGCRHQRRFMELFTERASGLIQSWPGYVVQGPAGSSVCEVSVRFAPTPRGTVELLEAELSRLQQLAPLIDSTIADIQRECGGGDPS